MTLDEWIELSADERNASRRHWERDKGKWAHLLADARTRFESKYQSHPLVNYIHQSEWFAGTHSEPSILVTTALYLPQLIEELPDRFCTFRVVQMPVLDNRDYYLRYWALLFHEFLGWSEAQTHEWARRWDDDLNGRDGGMFYHEDPYYYALPVVIEQSLPRDRAAAGDSFRLYKEVLHAIRSRGSEPIWASPYDWDAARKRVNAVLNEAGGRLPRR